MNVMTPLTLSIGINASTFICMYMYYKKRIYILASNIMEIPSKLLACMNMNVVSISLLETFSIFHCLKVYLKYDVPSYT